MGEDMAYPRLCPLCVSAAETSPGFYSSFALRGDRKDGQPVMDCVSYVAFVMEKSRADGGWWLKVRAVYEV